MPIYQTKHSLVTAYVVTETPPTSSEGITEVVIHDDECDDSKRTVKIKQEKSEIVTHQIAVGDYVVAEVGYFSVYPKDIFEHRYELSKRREPEKRSRECLQTEE